MNIEYSVNPETATQMLPHAPAGTPCWCKKRVNVLVDGVKVGEATTDHTGMMTATIHDPALAQMFKQDIAHLSLSPSLKEPSVPVVQTVDRF